MPQAPIRRSRLAVLVACALLGCLLVGAVRPAAAPRTVEIGGLSLIDYDHHQMASPGVEEGLHGFIYCRFMAGADPSNAFSGRARTAAKVGTFGKALRGPGQVVSSRDGDLRANSLSSLAKCAVASWSAPVARSRTGDEGRAAGCFTVRFDC